MSTRERLEAQLIKLAHWHHDSLKLENPSDHAQAGFFSANYALKIVRPKPGAPPYSEELVESVLAELAEEGTLRVWSWDGLRGVQRRYALAERKEAP